MSESASFLRRRWVRRTAVGGVLTVLAFAVIGFLVLPPVIRRVAETQIEKQLGRRASIERVRVNPFALSLAVENLQIFERDGITPFLGFARFYVNVQLSSLYRRAPVVEEIRLEGPHVHVVRMRPDGGASAGAFADLDAYNFSDILRKLRADGAKAAREAPAPPPPRPDAPAEPPPRFSVHNISLSEGDIAFDDRPTGDHHELSRLAIGIPFVSTLPVDLDTFVKPGVAVQVDGTPFSLDGKTKPFADSLETTLELRVQALDLARYQSYVPLPLAVRLDSGRLTVALDVAFVRKIDSGKGDAAVPVIRLAGNIGLADVAVRAATGAAGGFPSGPILTLAKLDTQITDANLAAMRFHLGRVLLSGLEIFARRLNDGSIDLQRLAPKSEPATATARATPAPRFTVDDLRLEKINLHLLDETVRPRFAETVSDITVSVKNLSNTPGARASMTASLRADPGGTLTQNGTLTLGPVSATGTVALDDLEPGRFAPYYRDQVAFDISRGRLKLGTGYRLATHGNATALFLDDAFLALDDLVLRQRGATADFLQLGTFAVRQTKVDVEGRTVDVGQISGSDVRVRASRGRNGIVDLTALGPPPAAGAPARKPAGKSAATSANAAPSAAPSPTASPWQVNVDAVDLENWSARFVDHAVTPDANLVVDGLALHAHDLSTKPGTRSTVDLRFGVTRPSSDALRPAALDRGGAKGPFQGRSVSGRGTVQVSGGIVAEPASADLRLDLRRLPILPFQPYFKDRVTLLVTDGAVSLKGRARLDPASASRAGVPGVPRFAFAGDLDIADFATVDGHRNERLLSWKSFHVGGINVTSQPPAVAIKEVTLTDFLARLMIFPDAHFNLEDILVKEPAGTATSSATNSKTPTATTPTATAKATAAAPTAPSAAAPRITIGEVVLQGGDVLFTDRLIQPHYSTEMTELAGHITGLSSAADTTAEVALRGAVDHSGQLTIDGKMNPLARQLYLDLRVNLKDFELPPTSPYAARYVGYGIDKGKLALSLDYHVANGKLDAQNKLTLDQLTFGSAVPSPDALHIPVRLAIAILKDRHGVIDIDLPVAGSLDDPDFKLARLILKTLGNLIIKAVTAPFSLIAKAFGGGDEESFLEFGAGLHAVDAKGLAKLRAVGKALQERPGLSFEIEGLADPQQDGGALRAQLYDRKLRAQKQRAIVESGVAAPPPSQLQIAPAERPLLIAAAYRAETFPKPRNPDGSEKQLAPAEMEKLMLAASRVEADDLRQLALRRAGAVKDAIAQSAPDAAARLFLVAPRTATPGNRVELKLKRD